MYGKKVLKKMGFKRTEDLNSMKIEELIKLGEMGYTKEEIEAIRNEEKEQQTTKPLIEQINALENQIAEIKKGFEVDASRETVSENESQENLIEQGLNLLAGGKIDE